MSLKSVQTYEVEANGVLKPVPNLVFETDGCGNTILGGSCSDLIDVSNISVDGSGKFLGFVDYNISAVIVGGGCNVSNNAGASFIGAGQNNYITGSTCAIYFTDPIYGYSPSCYIHGSRSFIGGGTNNSVCSAKSVIVGGHNNTVKGTSCGIVEEGYPYNIQYPGTITGEYANSQQGYYDTSYIRFICNGPGYNGIVGGKNNCIDAIFSIIGGGLNNKIISERERVTYYNQGTFPINGNLSGQFNFIGAGENVLIKNSCHSAILGGKNNSIDRSRNSVLVGGCCNLITGIQSRFNFSRVPISNDTLVGGFCNSIYGVQFSNQFIGGGAYNLSSGVPGSVILGGFNNSSVSSESFSRDNDSVNAILGGSCNSISGGQNVILGGLCNKITSNCCSSIIGGNCNTIRSDCASIVGGFRNNVSHIGAVLIGDYTSRSKTSAANHTLSLDFASGILLRSEYVPLTHTSNGYSGQISFDKDYFYRHNGDYWTKVPMATGDNQTIIGTKNFTTTPLVNGTPVALSDNVVDLVTSQNINGIKNFYFRPYVNGIGVMLQGEAGGNVSRVSAPATPNSAGSIGQIATDSDYFYSYNGSKWKRTALAEW
jgi:hypothetical protein